MEAVQPPLVPTLEHNPRDDQGLFVRDLLSSAAHEAPTMLETYSVGEVHVIDLVYESCDTFADVALLYEAAALYNRQLCSSRPTGPNLIQGKSLATRIPTVRSTEMQRHARAAKQPGGAHNRVKEDEGIMSQSLVGDRMTRHRPRRRSWTASAIALAHSSISQQVAKAERCTGSAFSTMFASTRLLSSTPSALPESVAWLEHLTLEMTTTINSRHGLGKRNVLYELHMTYHTSKDETATWTLSRSFDEYRDLRRRLLKALRLGHRCNAECKWLGNVIKHHFPRGSLFCRTCPGGVEGTRVALLRMLNTVKASLVNHGNLGCSRMRDDVSKIFTVFVSSSGRTCSNTKDLHSSTASTTSSLSSSISFSPTNFKRSSSSASLTSDDENHESALEFDDFSCGNFSRCECGECRASLNH